MMNGREKWQSETSASIFQIHHDTICECDANTNCLNPIWQYLFVNESTSTWFVPDFFYLLLTLFDFVVSRRNSILIRTPQQRIRRRKWKFIGDKRRWSLWDFHVDLLRSAHSRYAQWKQIERRKKNAFHIRNITAVVSGANVDVTPRENTLPTVNWRIRHTARHNVPIKIIEQL